MVQVLQTEDLRREGLLHESAVLRLRLCSPFPLQSHCFHRGPTGMVADKFSVDASVRARLHEFGIMPFEIVLVYWGKLKTLDDMRSVTRNDRAVMNMKGRQLGELLKIEETMKPSRLKEFWAIENLPSAAGDSSHQ